MDLTDDELNPALDTIFFYRNAKRDKRTELGLPLLLLREGDGYPAPGTLAGQILRAGAPATKLSEEMMRRELAEREARRMALEE